MVPFNEGAHEMVRSHEGIEREHEHFSELRICENSN